MSLFWSLLFGATLPAFGVWLFGRRLRVLSGQPGLRDYVRLRQRRAKKKTSRDPVVSLLVGGGERGLSDAERGELSRRLDPGDRYRPRR